MAADGVAPAAPKVDGGMARNGLFLQRLADILAVSIQRPGIIEATAWGAACLAAMGCGTFGSPENVRRLWHAEASFEPRSDPSSRQRELSGLHAALRRVVRQG